ncbi:hypothetical protein [Brevundimonas sp. NIBR11]|uniref:hypothetical protein n=1 Tax=Brevundimonas sp. NIBR11 TaxID=3015999 RepID=UPI0022F127A2|nr:hypothetical protein [Brevundimonas sp. NIBR11]WGM31267.1 hypothetical protein KKHFBJBL_01511 [Brevundimonas sp. NIBR11]
MADGTKTPWHLWLVGVVSLLWNGFGGYDFFMSMTQGEVYWRASGMTQGMIDHYNAMPTWMYVPWVLGVWGAVAGSILLLLRMKWAVHAFALSLFGAVVSLIYGLMHPIADVPPALAAMTYMPWVIAVIAALLLWYASAMGKRGVLR